MPAPGARIPVFLNAAAGVQATDPDELRGQLGADIVDIRTTEAGAFDDAIREAVRDGASVIGVAGGDGTMRAAAAVLAGSGVALACVPTGTLNNFARRAGILGIDDARTALQTGTTRDMPIGIVQDGVFLNTLTFGEYPRVVRMRERLRPYMGKWPAAAVAFVVAILTMRRIRVSLTSDTETVVRRTPFVWVGIGWGSFPRVDTALERRSSPDLEVAVLRSQSAAGGLGFLLRLAARLLLGRTPVRDSALQVLHTRTLTLDARRAIDATADGEVVRLVPPVRVTVRDAALRVLTGRGDQQRNQRQRPTEGTPP
ncbi:MAG TPA: diacylglycerol kinase family protein [Longimicrobiales bacterium]|nr:diacylglycerol kinase family protein [Longimicrobiales bacterium]